MDRMEANVNEERVRLEQVKMAWGDLPVEQL